MYGNCIRNSMLSNRLICNWCLSLQKHLELDTKYHMLLYCCTRLVGCNGNIWAKLRKGKNKNKTEQKIYRGGLV